MEGNLYTFIHDPEAADTWAARELPDTEDTDVPVRSQREKVPLSHEGSGS
jgi:hypothetical protein